MTSTAKIGEEASGDDFHGIASIHIGIDGGSDNGAASSVPLPK